MAAQLNLNTDKIEKIKTQVQSINDTASAQATTISEIAALLEGKSVPGGGGGSVDFSFYAYETIVDIPATVLNDPSFEGVTEVKVGYICPLDEIDFSEATVNNLVALVVLSETETASGAPIVYPVHQLLFLEKDDVSYRRTVDGLEKLMLDIPAYDASLPILVKLTNGDLASIGVNGQPGVYALGAPNFANAFPFIMMRIGS